MIREICVYEIRDYKVTNHTIFGEDVIGESGFEKGFQVRARVAEPEEPLIRSTNIPEDVNLLGDTILNYQSLYEDADMQYLLSSKILHKIYPGLTKKGID